MADNQRTTEVTVEVTTNSYDKNGQLIDAIASSAKLTKADAGRSAAMDEDLLTIKHNADAGTKAQIDYNNSATSTGDAVSLNTTIEVNVKGQVMDMTKGELIDAIAAGSKLTKADAGRMAVETSEAWLKLQVMDATDGNAPEAIAHSSSKLTKADAGKADTNA